VRPWDGALNDRLNLTAKVWSRRQGRRSIPAGALTPTGARPVRRATVAAICHTVLRVLRHNEGLPGCALLRLRERHTGRWRSELSALLRSCTRSEAPGRDLGTLLAPLVENDLVLKPKHSGFYSTTLDTVLTYLRCRRVILTGLTLERCLLFTANDAFLRDYELFVPRDGTTAIDDADEAAALRILERVLNANTTPSTELDLRALRRGKEP
jgi:hypothetical protein